MENRIKSLFVTLVLTFGLLFAKATVVRADDAAKPAVMPQIGLITVRSLDAAGAFIKQMGLDVPPPLDPAALEKQFAFIGKGGLDTTRPIGIVVCGGPNMDVQQMMAFVFPMKPTGATLDSLKALGGQMMPDHADTVVIGGVGLRRTADFLIFSPNAAVATSVDADAMVAAVKGPDVMAKLVIDFKALRTVLPDQYKALVESFQASVVKDAQTPEDKANAMMFATPIIKTIDSIDKLETGVESGEKGIRLSISATPLKVMPAAESAMKPGMPADVFARIDANIAASESSDAIRTQLLKDYNQGATADGKLTAAQKKEVEEIGVKLGEILFDPATTSIGVGAADAAPVVYVVQHWAKAKDVPAEVQQLVGKLNGDLGADAEAVKVDTYVEGGTKVLRLSHDSGKADGIDVDLAQRDNDVFITVSPSEKHLVASLLDAQAAGPMKGVFSGWVDLGKTLEAAGKIPASPLAALPADTQKQLADLLNGQKISIETSTEGETSSVQITISKGVLENIPKLIGVLTGAPKPDAK